MTESEIEQQEFNLALVERLYSDFANQDIRSLVNLLSEDIDWLFYGPEEIPFTGHYIGQEQVAEFFSKALESSEFLAFEPREFLPGSNRVLVQGTEQGRAKSTGRTWETDWPHVFTIENGKIKKMREYYDTAVVAAAFSPS